MGWIGRGRDLFFVGFGFFIVVLYSFYFCRIVGCSGRWGGGLRLG